MNRRQLITFQDGRAPVFVADADWAQFQLQESGGYHPTTVNLVLGADGGNYPVPMQVPDGGYAEWSRTRSADELADEAKLVELRTKEPDFFARKFGADWKTFDEKLTQKLADDAAAEAVATARVKR